jgi:hypothetical protein
MLISPAKALSTNRPKPYPVPTCRSRSRVAQRELNASRWRVGSDVVLTRNGSHGVNHCSLRWRTSVHWAKSLTISGRNMIRFP